MIKKMMQRPLLLSLFALLLIAAAGCGQTATGAEQDSSPASGTGNVDTSGAASHPVVTIEMDSGKKIKLELYPEVAPNTVNNFISLVKSGFYDGTTFHRVIPDFMIQGGDPDGIGTGGPGYSIKGEFKTNGVENNLKHTTGVLSMARLGDNPDSAGSQFFIMVADAPHLDGDYAAFGKVTEGMDVVNEIVSLPRDTPDKPSNPPVMKKVTVDTLGKEYPEPEKIQ
ncbi:peptidylprolyl isomerase [Paenibacillus oralis]|uniref:Peptidyl-prolyl cis-trans isomerase n=1 Tax=Paenibacillus oralis TaxID=2490856 RepID=A0A3P3U1J8_9BACL|nr:peptidylprolyl isomerase [Paenibacillus oralis]RRJ64217.1 peptidylprolyl isomerase [Paenibacillus oralis]